MQHNETIELGHTFAFVEEYLRAVCVVAGDAAFLCSDKLMDN
jgi:hypothetical protein